MSHSPDLPTSSDAPKFHSGVPVIPLRDALVLPHQIHPIGAGRPSTVAAVEAALARGEKDVFVVRQRDPSVETPTFADLHSIGTYAVIKKAARLPNGSVQVLVQGVERAVLVRLEDTDAAHLTARVRLAPVEPAETKAIEALRRENLELVGKLLALSKNEVPMDAAEFVERADDPAHAAYLAAGLIHLDADQEQDLLDAPTILDLLDRLHRYLSHELQVLEIRSEISSRAQSAVNDEQREYMLRKQLRAIQEELGEKYGDSNDVGELRERLDAAELPEGVRKEAERELRRLESMNPASPEHSVVRGYLEFLVELPWAKETGGEVDIAAARRILEEDHFGLEEVKERILEHLGVLKLNPNAKAPILCFVGPPGVGKTSLGRSIARALGRNYDRMSLGGLSDEAELRGHRRTYIGAMPGRLLQALRRAETRDPVLVLDEVDKLGRGWQGDPEAALLEVLDPEQNKEFRDNYLDQPFDLSKVLFVLTANDLDSIPRPLLDRLEIIRFAGYSEEEKLEIAKRYVVEEKRKEVGLDATRLEITDDALRAAIKGYTREAGVRQLGRLVGKIARKVALRFAEGSDNTVRIEAGDLRELLGPERFFLEKARETLEAGIAQGLAWTAVGGEVLYVETALLEGSKGGLTLTGQLGDVMKESATTARSYVWSHARKLGVDPARFESVGVHVHVPAGAIPKDGPSAGITMVAALTSLFTGRSLRKDTAMTGEVTLTGLVLPVGGIKEKVLAARRAEITRVILSRENEKDVHELPDYVRESTEFVYVRHVEEVLAAAFEGNGAARASEAA